MLPLECIYILLACEKMNKTSCTVVPNCSLFFSRNSKTCKHVGFILDFKRFQRRLTHYVKYTRMTSNMTGVSNSGPRGPLFYRFKLFSCSNTKNKSNSALLWLKRCVFLTSFRWPINFNQVLEEGNNRNLRYTCHSGLEFDIYAM